MNLRYGRADENVLKRSVADVILHEKQKFERQECGKQNGESRKFEQSRSGRQEFERQECGADQSHKKQSGGGSAGGDCSQFSGSRPEIPGSRFVSCAETLSEHTIGGLAVVRAVNSLAAEKIKAEIFCPLILLPPGTQEEKLREIMKQICSAAFSLDVEVRPGHIEVTDAVTRPVIAGSASGIPFSDISNKRICRREKAGTGRKSKSLKDKNEGETREVINDCETGISPEFFNTDTPNEKRQLEIVAAGWVGMEGTLILTADCREKLRERFPESLLARTDLPPEELSVLRAAEIAAEEGADLMVNLSDGGFMAGLWEVSKKADSGLEIDLKKVPILQETIEITEYFGVNPYLMKSEGCILVISREGNRLADRLMGEGIFASKIGFLTDTKDKIIRNGEEIRHLDRPQTDSLARFFQEKF